MLIIDFLVFFLEFCDFVKFFVFDGIFLLHEVAFSIEVMRVIVLKLGGVIEPIGEITMLIVADGVYLVSLHRRLEM